MSNVNTLSMKIYKDEWFALENVTMKPQVFHSLVNSLNKVFIEQYGVDGAKEHVNKVEKNDKLVLFINQRKVPNIIKSLVQSTNMEVEIQLTGKTVNGEEVTKTINKPFNPNDCTEVIPYYNKSSKR